MTTYQELESAKYLTDHVETESGCHGKKQKFWASAVYYSTVFFAGFFLLRFVGVNVADIFQPAVNAFVDWSISG